MGVKISERVKKHHLEWDEVRQDLLLKEYQPTTWNTGTTEYNMSLVGNAMALLSEIKPFED